MRIRNWISLGFMTFAVAIGMSGCGGNGRADLGDGVVFTQTRHILVGGGSVGSTRDKVRIVVPTNTLLYDTDFRVDILASQFNDLQREGWIVHNQGVRITVDPDSVRAGRLITIEMPYPGTYGAEETMLAVQNAAGLVFALDSRISPDGTYISGDLDFRRLDLLDSTPDNGDRNLETFRVFTATRTSGRAIPVLQTSVQPFVNGAWGGIVPDLTGKRVAVLVHGIDSSLADLTSLAQFIASYKLPLSSTPYYDAVIGFQYTSNNPLANIGEACAESLAPIVSTTSQSDLFAHSMGNLVSRYAMETSSLGSNRLGQWIHHFVGLGGPHTGIPFANVPLLQTLAWIFAGDSYYCLVDLVTHGEGGAPKTSFLTDLNTTTQGPDYNTASYFTMSGSDYAALYKGIIPEGHIVNGLYDLSVGLDTVNDGLVAQYSAQSNVLAQQSSVWQEGPTFNLDHTQLHDSPTAFNQIGNWIRAWGQAD